MTAFPAQQNRNNSVRIVGTSTSKTTRHDRDENNNSSNERSSTSSSNSRIRFRQQQSTRSAFYHPKLGPTVIAKLVNANSSSSCINNNAVSAILKGRGLDAISNEQQRQQAVATSVAAAMIKDEDQQQSVGHNNNCCWNFRPSALQYDDYGKGNMSITEIVDMYVRDNERATRDGVSIPSRPTSSAMTSPAASSSAITSDVSVAAAVPASTTTNTTTPLRCLQWNIQAFTSPKDERNIHTVTTGILQAIFDSESDILVLNEIHWRDEDNDDSSSSSSSSSSSNPVKTCDSQTLLEQELCQRGYNFSRIAVHGDTPTMIASRKPVLDYQEIILSNNRSALCILIDTTTGDKCWIVGTHLDAFDAKQRRSEIQIILSNVTVNVANKEENNNIPIVVMGDFNQQRPQDYTNDEWKRIVESANRRNIPIDDGVSTILEDNSFHCILDHVRQRRGEDDSCENGNKNVQVQCNWNKNEPPPSTHWSGTTIDYTYYYNNHDNNNNSNGNNNNITDNNTRIIPHGVYVSPAGFSDHRMTVTDWNIITTTTSTSSSSSSSSICSSSMTEAAATTTTNADAATTTTNADAATNPNDDAVTSISTSTSINKTFIFNGLPPKRHHAWAASYYNNKNNSDSTASISSLVSTDTDSSTSMTTTSSVSSSASSTTSSSTSSSTSYDDLKGLFTSSTSSSSSSSIE